MFSLRTTIVAVLTLSLLALILPQHAPQSANIINRRYRLEIHNHSEVEIYSIYMSQSYETKWGRDRLGESTLTPRHYLPIEDIIPGEYDFLFVDEYDRRCMRRDVQIFEDITLDIEDDWLDRHCKR